MNYNEKMLRSGAVLACIAVIAGAFGSHGLKKIINSESLEIYKTANTYQFFHSFAILFISLLSAGNSQKLLNWAYYLFIIGIFLFSGSLYLLSVREVLGIPNAIGAITPFGGLCFISAWICLIIFSLKRNN